MNKFQDKNSVHTWRPATPFQHGAWEDNDSCKRTVRRKNEQLCHYVQVTSTSTVGVLFKR